MEGYHLLLFPTSCCDPGRNGKSGAFSASFSRFSCPSLHVALFSLNWTISSPLVNGFCLSNLFFVKGMSCWVSLVCWNLIWGLNKVWPELQGHDSGTSGLQSGGTSWAQASHDNFSYRKHKVPCIHHTTCHVLHNHTIRALPGCLVWTDPS